MSYLLQRLRARMVKLLLYSAALASVVIDRISYGGDALELMTAESPLSPQQMLMHVTAVMIAGSLSMIALGYSTRA